MSTRQSIAPAWREHLAAVGVRDLGLLLSERGAPPPLPGEWELLSKPGLGGRQRWRWWPAGQRGPLYVKRYQRTPLGQQWDRIRRQTPRHSRSWWEFELARRLSAAHIPVPQAIGYVEQMHGALESGSAVILASVPGDALDRAWSRAVAERAPLAAGLPRHDLATRLGRFVSAFHQTGYCHRDLYLCHIFAELDPTAQARPRFALIDLARVHRPCWRRMRWVLKDLAQLDASARQVGASRCDRYRFLLAYLGLLPDSQRVRWYARRITARSDVLLRRIARRAARRRPG